MLSKLFKYDFKWITKITYAYFVVLALVSIALKIVESVEQSFLLVIVDKALVSMFIGCSVSIMITCGMRIWARIIRNVYGDESYLTHTLPVTKNQIFNAKVLAGIASLLMSALFIVICLAFVYLNKSTIEHIKVMYDSLVAVYNSSFAVLFIVGMVLLIALEIIYIMMAGILGLVIGHRSNNYKILKSVVAGIASYSLLSVLSFVIVYIISSVTKYDIIGNGFPSMNYIAVMGATMLIIYTVYNIAYYLIAKKLLNKGVNVD